MPYCYKVQNQGREGVDFLKLGTKDFCNTNILDTFSSDIKKTGCQCVDNQTLLVIMCGVDT